MQFILILQKLAYKVTYRRLRLKLDYPAHPYNSNTHNRKVLHLHLSLNTFPTCISIH